MGSHACYHPSTGVLVLQESRPDPRTSFILSNLIELLVVSAVIAVFSAIANPDFLEALVGVSNETTPRVLHFSATKGQHRGDTCDTVVGRSKTYGCRSLQFESRF